MTKDADHCLNRRDVLLAGAALPLGPAEGLWPTDTAVLAPTPACTTATPRSYEGPFYRPSSPQRLSLVEAGNAGTRVMLTGVIRSTSCQPIEGALLDFWQADSDGHYDAHGFTMRGQQYSDDQGRYRLETFIPGLYPGRTRHIHVKLQRPGGDLLTTELYFPGEPRNLLDGQFTIALLVNIMPSSADRPKVARYDFVLG